MHSPLRPTGAKHTNRSRPRPSLSGDYRRADVDLPAGVEEVPVAAAAANSAFAEEAVRTQPAGHNLICERTGTLHEIPGRVAEMWQALLPLIAADAWWERHPSRARR